MEEGNNPRRWPPTAGEGGSSRLRTSLDLPEDMVGGATGTPFFFGRCGSGAVVPSAHTCRLCPFRGARGVEVIDDVRARDMVTQSMAPCQPNLGHR